MILSKISPNIVSLLKTGFTPTTQHFNQFLLFLSQSKRFKLITHLVKSHQFKKDSQTHRIYIQALVKEHKCEKALSVLQQDCDGKVLLSSFTFSSLIYSLCSQGRMDLAIEVLELMTNEKNKYPFDNFVCSCVISGFLSVGKAELAVEFFENAVNLGYLKPNVVTYTALVSAYYRLGRIDEVQDLVARMKIYGLELDVVFYSNWIYGYFREGAIEEALRRYSEMAQQSNNVASGIPQVGFGEGRMYNEMVCRRFELDTIGYTILIDGFSKEGHVEKAVGFLYEMKKRGVQPNLVTLTAVILGFCKKGKMCESFAVFKMVEELGIEADEFIYAVLIDGVCRKGDIVRAFELLSEMEKKGIKPSVVTYNTIINGLCKAGRMIEADDVSKGISGDIITYSTLLHGYIQEENVIGMVEIKNRVEAADVSLDVTMCNFLIKGLFMMGLFEDALAIYKKISDMGLTSNFLTYCTMIEGYSKVGMIDEALEIFDEFRKASITSVACYNCTIQGLCRNGMPDMAVEVFVELIDRGLPLSTRIYMSLIKKIFGVKGALGVLDLFQRLGRNEHENFDSMCSDAVSLLCNKGLSEAAFDLLMVIQSNGFVLSKNSYYLLMRSLLYGGKTFLTGLLLTTFIKKYEMFELRAAKILVYFLCIKNVETAVRFLATVKGGISEATFPAEVLRTLTKGGRYLDAFNLVVGAGDKLPLMDVVDYSIIIDGLCKGGHIDKALNLCNFAKNKGISFNIVTYNSVINGLCRQGCVVEAFRLFDSLEKIDVAPSEITCGILIDTLSKEGLLEDARRLFAEMSLKNLRPNTRIYNSLIDGYSKLGQVQETMKLLLDLQAEGLTPDEFTVSAVLNSYCQKGDMEGALGFFSEFKLRPDFLGFMYLVRGLCDKGRMEESRCILREMFQSKSVIDLLGRVESETGTESIISFLSQLCERGSIQEAVNILNEVASMFFPVRRGWNLLEEPNYDGREERVDSKDLLCKYKIDIDEAWTPDKASNNRSNRDNQITQLLDFSYYYSRIALLCSKGEYDKANEVAKVITGFT
ncbi:pentatricopeptide repeat-containing protein At5g57250, mitochondrial [Lycium ferocissimum]|uniref:pentatricopeptide repeat-containing protein At5g57250, mitochondrial n=1 Tax=Lycium ferocissimum TaxID=112874 RepID=UPI002816212A|nr:pentatricopeptide repeat-containing protein At5g57250, mitochondrial [Lycium ferocissimum]XP_059296897.1 pentatricopeptide repeat-containing protein At5g57250, mitochondrial [Lycium ferocissimum]XP_059296898.1 pentatricopeptide repeat-containing protein At5g57250, mitochondrial [Lycium ferocissimum]XP_059296900.1 pentatricopeptide repeat-containing protein At5g57250, mitochondrial [Lycium ferocissimum]XP_059296901.1 pentatricopeptide repeat-containing protein At5g57250, mitochondrial [Lycium